MINLTGNYFSDLALSIKAGVFTTAFIRPTKAELIAAVEAHNAKEAETSPANVLQFTAKKTAKKAPQVKTAKKPVYMAPKAPEAVKEPKAGTVAGNFVEAFRKGATEAELQALIPATNKAKPREFMRYMGSYGFGIQQDGDKFYLIDPREVSAANHA